LSENAVAITGRSALAVLTALIFFMSSLVALSPPALASVPACGSVVSSSMVLSGNVGPCSGNGITVNSSGITFDCAGHSVAGSGRTSIGIRLLGVSAVHLKNCRVSGFSIGVYVSNTTNSVVTGVAASFDTTGFSIDALSSGDFLISNVAINDSEGFLVLPGSSSNLLKNNLARYAGSPSGGNAFDIQGSSNTLYGNSAVWTKGVAFSVGNSSILASNRATGYTNGFSFGSKDTLISNYANGVTKGADGFTTTNSSGNSLKGNGATGNQYGFTFYSSSFNSITYNTALKNIRSGFLLGEAGACAVENCPRPLSQNNTLKGNVANLNGLGHSAPASIAFENGFDVTNGSFFNSLTQNSANRNGYDGFHMSDSNRNTLTYNFASRNNGSGFQLEASNGNTVANDRALSDSLVTGSGFLLDDSAGNVLTRDSAGSNRYDGFFLVGSSNDTLSSSTAIGNLLNGYALGSIGVGWPISSRNILTKDSALGNGNQGFVSSSGATFNILSNNNARSNRANGFLNDISTSNQLVSSNKADLNRGYGYADQSSGPGTLGTGNFYSVDECSGNLLGGSSPGGAGAPQH
jgi:parallel beta-helix repeat protein